MQFFFGLLTTTLFLMLNLNGLWLIFILLRCDNFLNLFRNFGMTLGVRDSRKIIGRHNLTGDEVHPWNNVTGHSIGFALLMKWIISCPFYYLENITGHSIEFALLMKWRISCPFSSICTLWVDLFLKMSVIYLAIINHKSIINDVTNVAFGYSFRIKSNRVFKWFK